MLSFEDEYKWSEMMGPDDEQDMDESCELDGKQIKYSVKLIKQIN